MGDNHIRRIKGKLEIGIHHKILYLFGIHLDGIKYAKEFSMHIAQLSKILLYF